MGRRWIDGGDGSVGGTGAPRNDGNPPAEFLAWVQNGAAEDALSGDVAPTPVQGDDASTINPLTPLGSELRMEIYLEGIGRRYGTYADETAARTGNVREIGGVIGLLDGELMASRIYSGAETGYASGGMNLASIQQRVMQQLPRFVPLYTWHFHPSENIALPGDRSAQTGYGFSAGDISSTRRSALRGAYIVMPDRVLYVSKETADQIPPHTGFAPSRPRRQWTPRRAPWPWRSPH